jgi:NADPH-dependent FMN reductase
MTAITHRFTRSWKSPTHSDLDGPPAETGINVLVIVGTNAKSVNDAVTQLATGDSSTGITVNMFTTLGMLPQYSEAADGRRTSDAVVALRTATTEADAVLVLTNYQGRVPATLHNAIDWLTLAWNQSGLHDKPLAVMGRSKGCYSGVWSHCQASDGRGSHVIESLTVATLREAVRTLADEVNTPIEPS